MDTGTAVARARVETLLVRHRAALLWVARRWTGSADEAEDALQRALEIYVRRLDSVDAATEFAWMKVVVRHEAMAIARLRRPSAPLEEEDLPAVDAGLEERLEREERQARSLEALAQLKPDERTALLLKAEGFSYREIGERQGWTYTKVNRALTEGRRRFLQIFARIESGAECERFAPTLLALVDGAATSTDVVALRPHLRHCASCRASVRELHASRRHRVALYLPFVAGIAPVRWLGERVSERPGGGKGMLHGLAGRVTAPDVASSVQIASSGGGRGPAVAALLSVCLGGGAGTYCVATGGLPDPTRLIQRSGEPERARVEKPRARPRPDRSPARVAPAVTATATPAPPRRVVKAAATRAKQAAKPTAQRAKAQRDRGDAQDEFSFESTAGTQGGGGGGAATATASAATAAPPASSSGGGGGSATPSRAAESGGEFLP